MKAPQREELVRRLQTRVAIERSAIDGPVKSLTLPIREVEQIIDALSATPVPEPGWESLQAVRNCVTNDEYAMTFQTLGQYRAALLLIIDALSNTARGEQA